MIPALIFAALCVQVLIIGWARCYYLDGRDMRALARADRLEANTALRRAEDTLLAALNIEKGDAA